MMKVGTMDILIGCIVYLPKWFCLVFHSSKGHMGYGALVFRVSKGHAHANVYRLKQLNALLVDGRRNCGDSYWVCFPLDILWFGLVLRLTKGSMGYEV